MRKASLRTIVGTIDAQIARLASLPEAEITAAALLELQISWTQLVTVMALGPEPEDRTCARCDHVIMRLSTRCAYCWTRIAPLSSN